MELKLRMARLAKEDRFPFHMPGHKGKFPAVFGDFDPTELPGLDNLHSPQGVLARAQAKVADIYKVHKTYFLVNGSSTGIMAAITSLIRPGDLILVTPTCHKSVLAGLVHSGAMPVWVRQEFCLRRKLWLPPTPDQVHQLLAAHSVQAAIFTNPDYYGQVPDLQGITEVCHAHGVPVIVDEAHGAHLFFGQGLGLPKSGVGVGCDIIVQSPHKTLPALTQAAWMHIGCADVDRVQESLNIFHTTSPSYLLLASLEYAAHFAKTRGARLLKRLSLLAKVLDTKLAPLNLPDLPEPAADWTKFLLPNRRGLLEQLLAKGIYPELVQQDKILFMLTMADAIQPAGIAQLQQVLDHLPHWSPVPEREISVPPLPTQACTPREAWLCPGEKLSIGSALGRVSRQVVAPYPPGTMVVAPGQRLGEEQIDYLEKLRAEKVIPEWIEVI